MKADRTPRRRRLPSSPFHTEPVEPEPAGKYQVDDRVSHDRHGMGTVVRVEGDVHVVVDFGSELRRIQLPTSKLVPLWRPERVEPESSAEMDETGAVTTEFIDDPIVPLALTMPGGSGRASTTLYHPGWIGTEDEQSQAFIGVPGETVYAFDDARGLAEYLAGEHVEGLAPGPDLDAVRGLSADALAARVLAYDMVRIPELVDGELSHDEQASLGSTLALGLDLADFLELDDDDSNALRDDEDVSKLAAGDEVLALFRAARHREQVVRLIRAHWLPTMTRAAAMFSTP